MLFFSGVGLILVVNSYLCPDDHVQKMIQITNQDSFLISWTLIRNLVFWICRPPRKKNLGLQNSSSRTSKTKIFFTVFPKKRFAVRMKTDFLFWWGQIYCSTLEKKVFSPKKTPRNYFFHKKIDFSRKIQVCKNHDFWGFLDPEFGVQNGEFSCFPTPKIGGGGGFWVQRGGSKYPLKPPYKAHLPGQKGPKGGVRRTLKRAKFTTNN